MTTLLDAARMLSSELDFRDIVHQVLTKAIAVIPAADAGTLYLEDKDSGRLVVSDSVGFGPTIFKLSLNPGEAAAGRAFVTQRGAIYSDRKAVFASVDDATSDTVHNFREASQGARSPKAAMTAPLTFKGTVLGVLVVNAFREEGIFGEDDLDMLQDFAQIAATAIANARLYESERDHRVRLQVLNGEITRQRDELDQRLSALDSMAQIARQELGLPALANQLARLTASRVYVLDGLARVRALAPAVSDPEHARQLLGSTHCVELLRRAGTDHHPRAVIIERAHLVVTPIVSGADLLGYVLVEAIEPASPSINEALAEIAALIASTVFVRERASEDGAVRSRAELLERLLDGGAPKSAGAFQALPPPLQLAVARVKPAEPGSGAPDSNLLREICAIAQQMLDTRLVPTVAIVRGEHIVLVWSSGQADTELNVRQKLEAIAAAVQTSTAADVRFVFTDIVRDPQLVQQAYREARLAVDLRPGDEGVVAEVGGLGAFRLVIGAASSSDALAFSRRTLGRVLEHDRKHNTLLTDTLRVYLANGLSASTAARKLHVHVHTVRYRLTRLEDMTGLSLQRTEDRLTLDLALRILDLAGLDASQEPR
jgi:GAF domain-containing protein